MTASQDQTATPDVADRPLRPAVFRGWRRRCPKCGEGHMMEGYLKVRDTCPNCGEELFHHRADDGPAFLTLLIVGQLLGHLMLVTYHTWRPGPTTMLIIFALGAVILSLYLLPRLKGALVNFQWAKRMHGFG